jgi:hypothetical protein
MLAIVCLCAGGCVVPFLKPPSINTSFNTLTVQDKPINYAVEASSYLTTGSSKFWGLSTDSPPPAAASGAPSPPARRLLKDDGGKAPYRDHVEHSLHVIFHRADKTTMLTRPMITKVKAVEDALFDLPDYQRICLQKTNPDTGAHECRRPVSVTNFIYGSVTTSGFIPDGNSNRQLDPVNSAQVRSYSKCCKVMSFLLVGVPDHSCAAACLRTYVSLNHLSGMPADALRRRRRCSRVRAAPSSSTPTPTSSPATHQRCAPRCSSARLRMASAEARPPPTTSTCASSKARSSRAVRVHISVR